MKQRTDLFGLFYYSQIQLGLGAMFLTGAVSAVLTGEVIWNSILIVGLSTYIVYSIDNLIDWNEDRERFRSIEQIYWLYRIWCYLTIPLATLVVMWLTIEAHQGFFSLLALAGTLSLGTVLLQLARRAPQVIHALRDILPNRLFISLVWAVIAVYVPVWYLNQPTVPQTWMALAFVWQLTFVNAVLWSLEILLERTTGVENDRVAGIPVLTAIRALQVISFSAVVLAVVDILLGYFPIYNIVIITTPLLNMITLQFWQRSRGSLRQFNTSLILGQIICSMAVALMHCKGI